MSFNKSFYRTVFPFSLGILIFLFSCKTIKTTAPTESYEKVVIPPEVSELVLPVELKVKDLETKVNKEINGLVFEDKDYADDNLLIKVWKYENIKIEVEGPYILYTVPVKVWLKAGYGFNKYGITFNETGETDFAIKLKFKTLFALDPFWNFAPKTNAVEHQWIKEPDLKFLGLDIPLTFIADKIVKGQLNKLASLIDDLARKNLDVRKYVLGAWEELHKPIAVSTDPEVWVRIAPRDLFLTPVDGRGGIIRTAIGMKATVETFLGPKPQYQLSGLPNKREEKNYEGKFNLLINAEVPFDKATELARKRLVGQVYEFNDGKKKIKIENVDLYGSEMRLVVKVDISGSLKGTIYLSGLPNLDIANKVISVKSLDFDIDTRNKLLKSADWLSHQLFVKKIQPYFSYSFEKDLIESKKEIQKFLTHNKVHHDLEINGEIQDVLPKDVYLTEQSLKAVMLFTGVINADIQGLDF